MEAFNFRIIKTANGAEIIDSTLSTPYNSLTPLQMMDYINVENSLYFTERKRRLQKATEPTVIDKVTEDVHTKTGEKLFVVKPDTELSKSDFADVKRKLATLQGFYSSFKKGFIFKYDPTEKLSTV